MSTSYSVKQIQSLSAIALMSALVAAGALFHVQLGPVPITFQDFFVCLTGFLLGPRRGALAIILYCTAGVIGLPVFSGGRSGFAHLFGPTGGYIIGFPFMAAVAGFGAQRITLLSTHAKKTQLTWIKPLLLLFLTALASMAVIYCTGTLWLCWKLQLSLGQALSIGVVPFLPFAFCKMFLAAVVYTILYQKKLTFL